MTVGGKGRNWTRLKDTERVLSELFSETLQRKSLEFHVCLNKNYLVRIF